MADINEIIAGGAKTNANFDLNSLINVPARQAAEERYKQEGRDLFKGGIPTIQNPDGTTSVDWGQVSKKLIGYGNIPQAVSTETTGIARDQLRLGAQAMGQSQAYETGQPQQPLLPRSVNSQAPVTTPPPNRGGVQPQFQPQPQPQVQPQPQAGSPRGDQPGSIVSLIQGRIPDELAGPIIGQVSAMARIDPNATIPPEMLPRIQQVVQAAIARMTGGGVSPAQASPQPTLQPGAGVPANASGVYGPGAVMTGGPPPPVIAQGGPQPGSSVPMQPTPVPTQAIQGQPTPVTAAVTTTGPPTVPSQIDKGIALYTALAQNVGLTKEQRDFYQKKLEDLQKQRNLTDTQKDYAQYLNQFQGPGRPLSQDAWQVQNAADKANATKLGENFATKYEGAIEGGIIAASTLPKVNMALSIIKNDPNFYSGVGEQYNLTVKKIAASLGLPDTGVGQQLVAKTVADQTVNAIRAFAASSPVGRVLQKEVEAITTSLGNTSNTKAALPLLLQVQRNTLQAMAATSDLAQNHNGGSGRLDPAYDRNVTNYLRNNPVIDNNLRAQIEQATGQNKTQAPAVSTPVRVTSPAARDALPRGTQYIAPDGSVRIRQ